jgi:glycosyltransferase involved in cell wall biosynthesis
MYPTQFDGVVPVSPEDRERRLTAFPDFTPVGLVPESGQVGNYFLFVGYPWERKGVDVLIKAWKRLAPSFPGVTLKIVGFCPDLAPWEALRGDETSIEFHRPRPHPEIMKLMANCAGFVLPSRCEGVARVLVEAMAAGKPVVTTAVDGHPFHVRDGETGYLVPPDDVDALAAAITRVLADPERAARLGAAARTYVRAALSEEQYVERFHDMAERTLHGGRPRRAAGTEDPSVRPAPAF